MVGLGGKFAGGVARLGVGMGPYIVLAAVLGLLWESVPECGTSRMVSAHVRAVSSLRYWRLPAMYLPQPYPGELGSAAAVIKPGLPKLL